MLYDGVLCCVCSQNGDEDWSVDTSEEAVKARTENLSEHISALALSGDAELSSYQRVDKFYKFVDVRAEIVSIMKYVLHVWSCVCVI